MSMPLMKCGCRAQGNDLRTGKPVCVVHIGIKAGADEVAADEPDLTQRQAKCVYCSRTVPSSEAAAFFVFHPDRPQDEFYCGCRGWD